MWYLRQKHRAEFAGTDQRDPDWFAGHATVIEEAMKVHGGPPFFYSTSFGSSPSGTSAESILRIWLWHSELELASSREYREYLLMT
jgi:hypothetical protein